MHEIIVSKSTLDSFESCLQQQFVIIMFVEQY